MANAQPAAHADFMAVGTAVRPVGGAAARRLPERPAAQRKAARAGGGGGQCAGRRQRQNPRGAGLGVRLARARHPPRHHQPRLWPQRAGRARVKQSKHRRAGRRRTAAAAPQHRRPRRRGQPPCRSGQGAFGRASRRANHHCRRRPATLRARPRCGNRGHRRRFWSWQRLSHARRPLARKSRATAPRGCGGR